MLSIVSTQKQELAPQRARELLSGLAGLQVLGNIVMSANMNPYQRVAIDDDIRRYCDIYGSCERIVKTPIHRNWTSHTVRFCIIWLTGLPFALWPVYGWYASETVRAALYLAQCLLYRQEVVSDSWHSVMCSQFLAQDVNASGRNLR